MAFTKVENPCKDSQLSRLRMCERDLTLASYGSNNEEVAILHRL